MKRTVVMLILGLSTVFLLACGGGGGGTTSTAGSTAPDFSSWSNFTLGTASTVSGIGESVTFTGNSVNNNIAFNSPTSGAASLTVTYSDTASDSHPVATSATILAAGVTTTAPRNTATSIARSARNFALDNFQSTDQTVNANVVNPFSAGWDYQTFGSWNQVSSLAANSTGQGGIISVGLETAGASIPTAGTATYNGLALGRATQNGSLVGDGSIPGNDGLVLSDMVASVNFVSRNINFSTTNSQILTANGDTPNANYNLTGTLSYNSSSNAITGAATSTGGLTGNINGRFFGPAAQEIGGTFFLGGGTSVFSGGFGGKQ